MTEREGVALFQFFSSKARNRHTAKWEEAVHEDGRRAVFSIAESHRADASLRRVFRVREGVRVTKVDVSPRWWLEVHEERMFALWREKGEGSARGATLTLELEEGQVKKVDLFFAKQQEGLKSAKRMWDKSWKEGVWTGVIIEEYPFLPFEKEERKEKQAERGSFTMLDSGTHYHPAAPSSAPAASPWDSGPVPLLDSVKDACYPSDTELCQSRALQEDEELRDGLAHAAEVARGLTQLPVDKTIPVPLARGRLAPSTARMVLLGHFGRQVQLFLVGRNREGRRRSAHYACRAHGEQRMDFLVEIG